MMAAIHRHEQQEPATAVYIPNPTEAANKSPKPQPPDPPTTPNQTPPQCTLHDPPLPAKTTAPLHSPQRPARENNISRQQLLTRRSLTSTTLQNYAHLS